MAPILIVDDDENLRAITAEMLRAAGHTVDTAGDGKAGLELYKAKLHDVVITDIVMPDMDGLELIECLRHAEPRPHIISISGCSDLSESAYLPTAIKLGAQRSPAKPLIPMVLLQTVAEMLAMPTPATIAPEQP